MPEIVINSDAIYYESTGNGPPVLFLHGLGSSTRDWERQVPHFARAHRVVTVDLLGHGQSDKPAGKYRIEQFSSNVATLMETLELPPCAVVGISLGGMVAFQLAVDHPELIERLVVVNALSDNDLLQQAKGQILMRRLIVQFLGLERMGKVLGARLFPDEGMEEERALMAQRWAENDKKAYQKSLQAAVDWPGVTERLDGFDRPMLTISSDEDYVPLEQKQPYMDALPQMEHVVIPDARHAVPMERPEQFNEVLGEFLTR